MRRHQSATLRANEEMMRNRDETGRATIDEMLCAMRVREHSTGQPRRNHSGSRARLTHDDLGLGDARRDALVRQDRRAVDVQLVFNGDIVTQDRDVLQTRLQS